MLKRLQAAAAATQEVELERKPEVVRSPSMGTESSSDRKKSFAIGMMGPRQSIGGPSLIGLMASKRFAKKLSLKAFGARNSSSAVAPPPPDMEPTYRMEPKIKFNTLAVKEIIDNILNSRLSGMRYSAKLTPKMGKSLSDEIKDKVKSLNIERYKIVCVLTIGEMGNQGLMLSSRCAWDSKFDDYVTSSFQNKDIFCSVTVYGIFRE